MLVENCVCSVVAVGVSVVAASVFGTYCCF